MFEVLGEVAGKADGKPLLNTFRPAASTAAAIPILQAARRESLAGADFSSVICRQSFSISDNRAIIPHPAAAR
jgi:hypothetical protein